MTRTIILAVWLGLSFGAAAQNQVIVCDKTVPNQCQGVDNTGAAKVAATVNVAGAADLPGNTATFNANNVCTAVLTGGEQSVGFHLDSGTLGATLTAFGTQAIGAVNCASAGTCTAISTSAGATIVVTNPNGVKDVSISALPGMRQVEVCTGSSGTTGSATGVVTATYLNATSSGGGGGSVIVTSLPSTPAGTNVIGHIIADSGSTTAVTSLPALPSGTNVIGHTISDTGSTTAVTSLPATPAGTNIIGKVGIDPSGNGVSAQGLGAVNAPFGAPLTVTPPIGSTIPQPVSTLGSTVLAAAPPDNAALATILNVACTSQTACTGNNQSIQWPMTGSQGATLTIAAEASALGTALTCDPSWDGGVTFVLGGCDLWQMHGVYRKGALTNADVLLAASTPQQWLIYAPASPNYLRIRMATFSGGSVTVVGLSTMAPATPFPFWAKPQSPGAVTLTSSVAETTLIAAVAGTFLDLTDLSCTTSAATAHTVTVRDTTGGATRKTISCPAAAGPCEGWTFPAPLQQTALNTNWTVQSSASVVSDFCSATAVQR